MKVKNGAWIDAGAGPLRVRPLPIKSFGRCTAKGCPVVDELYDGLCDWHRWMTNDDEVNPSKGHKRGRDPIFVR